MALWGKRDQLSDVPKFTTSAEDGNKGADDYGTKVFGVDAAEAATAGEGTTQGWVKVTTGTGGRSGRVTRETLVAMSNDGFKNDAGEIEDATDFVGGSANTTGTADDGTFADS